MVVGAAARDQDPARPQQLHGAQVDLFVAANGRLQLVPGFRERRRVEDDGVVAGPAIDLVAQQVEDVGLANFDVSCPVPFHPALRLSGRLGAHLHRQHMACARRHLQRKAAGVAEAVEALARRVGGRGQMVLALVEKGAGLLAVDRVRQEGHRTFVVLHEPGRGTAHDALAHRQAFQVPGPPIVALDDGYGRELLLKDVEERLPHDVHRGRERLDGKDLPVAVDDQPGEQVGFAVDEPKPVRLRH
jgi:uncharacterized protein (DUF2164 family)